MIGLVSDREKYQSVELGYDAVHDSLSVVTFVDGIHVQCSAPFVQPLVVQIVNERHGPVVNTVVVTKQVICNRRRSLRKSVICFRQAGTR